jgi:hypothetical protein
LVVAVLDVSFGRSFRIGGGGVNPV